MPLVGSPGVAFIVVDDPPGTSANAVFNSVLSGWPVLVLTLLMALLSGIVIWSLVSVQSRTQSPWAFWSAGNRSVRLWDNGSHFPRKCGFQF